MKKIPESFELNEEDIKEAIEYWLNNHEDYGDSTMGYDFNITFKTEERRVPPPGRHRGGMSDDQVLTVITAVAVKEE